MDLPMDLLLTNLIYVSYRLIVSGPIVKTLYRFLPFMLAVVVMAQLSFAFDTFVFQYYFNNITVPSFLDYCSADVVYTIRVMCAWFIIKLLWGLLGNYWIALFIGAEMTFICDYYIFHNLFC
jgi:hypothetical protein